jgi:hypothetical protein
VTSVLIFIQSAYSPVTYRQLTVTLAVQLNCSVASEPMFKFCGILTVVPCGESSTVDLSTNEILSSKVHEESSFSLVEMDISTVP